VTRLLAARVESAPDADLISPGFGTSRALHGTWRPELPNRGRFSATPTQWPIADMAATGQPAESPRKGSAHAGRELSWTPPGGRAIKAQIGSRPGRGLPRDATASLPSRKPLDDQPAGTLDLERAVAHDEAVHPACWTPSHDGGETRHVAPRRDP
jgi:hypothetical protein